MIGHCIRALYKKQEPQFSVLSRESDSACGLIAVMEDAIKARELMDRGVVSAKRSMVAKLTGLLLSLTSPQIRFFLSFTFLFLLLPLHSPLPPHLFSTLLSLSFFSHTPTLFTHARTLFHTTPSPSPNLSRTNGNTSVAVCPVFVSKGFLYSSTDTTTSLLLLFSLLLALSIVLFHSSDRVNGRRSRWVSTKVRSKQKVFLITCQKKCIFSPFSLSLSLPPPPLVPHSQTTSCQ